jgi:D-alanine-D-alanine ligase
MTLKVAVICGGPSAEADVSRKSAQGVVAALKSAGHSVTLHELDERLVDALLAARPEVVFPITHGAIGEDGCLQGLLEVLNLPYVGCGVLASALAADKPFAKCLWRTHGLPVPAEVVVSRCDDPTRGAARAREQLGANVVIKPAHGGSAIGVHRVSAEQPLEAIAQAIESVLGADEQALIEPLLSGVEVTCGILEDMHGSPRALPPTLIVPKLGDFYDFASKYAPGGSQHVCPAPLQPATFARVQELAVRAHQVIGGRDLSRVDFFVDERRTPVAIAILEINTLPGMTATSLYPEAAAAMGLTFPALCDQLVRTALARPIRKAPAVELIPTGA